MYLVWERLSVGQSHTKSHVGKLALDAGEDAFNPDWLSTTTSPTSCMQYTATGLSTTHRTGGISVMIILSEGCTTILRW